MCIRDSSNIEITDSNIKAFESTAKKYNIDFSLKKVKGEQIRYLVFFIGRVADVMTAALQEFSAKKRNKDKKPSIRKALAAAKDKAKQLNAARDKVKKMDMMGRPAFREAWRATFWPRPAWITQPM